MAIAMMQHPPLQSAQTHYMEFFSSYQRYNKCLYLSRPTSIPLVYYIPSLQRHITLIIAVPPHTHPVASSQAGQALAQSLLTMDCTSSGYSKWSGVINDISIDTVPMTATSTSRL